LLGISVCDDDDNDQGSDDDMDDDDNINNNNNNHDDIYSAVVMAEPLWDVDDDDVCSPSLLLSYRDVFCLAYLRPSRELLEYYRKKIAEFDDEREAMLERLDQYKMTYEEQVSH